MFEDILSWMLWMFILGGLIVLGLSWVRVYNTFQFMRLTANQRLSNVEILVKQRYDMIMAVVQTAKKYNLHENQTFKDTSEARAHWDTKAPLNDRVRALEGIENNFLRVNAVVEQYPELKAVLIQNKVLDTDVDIETKLADARILYNQIAKDYNYTVKVFPLSVVAWVHHFKMLDFMTFVQTEYVPTRIYGD